MKGAATTLFIIFLLFCGFRATAQCDSTQVKVRVKITPDLSTDEISWQILNTDREVVANGNYRSKTVCLPKDKCYIFNLMDSDGNGMDGWLYDGKCELFVDDVKVDEVEGNYGSLHQFAFGCQPGEACMEAVEIGEGTYTTTFEDSWYLYSPDSSGLYEINACGNACGTGIWIYDPCPKNWADAVTGTVAFSSTGCSGEGAMLSTSLIAGKTYLIRIGDMNDDCSSTALGWSLTYIGPIRGCLDPAACNYDPTATLGDTCYYPGNPQCAQGPDLELDREEIISSMVVRTLSNADQCAIDEGCLSGYNRRYILRFTTRIENIGDQDFYIGRTPDNPQEANSQFKWDDCHQHWHYYGYAEYLLYDDEGNRVPVGFKNGFCVEDLSCPQSNMYKYTCENMGITKGCADIYDRDLDCQWIDLTDVDTGRYTFVVRVNYDRTPDALGHVEQNYANNFAQVCIHMDKNIDGRPIITFPADCPEYTDCAGVPFGNAEPDCKGICGGHAKKGDINSDQAVNSNDVSEYMNAALSSSVASTCIDLNADTLINIADAALAQDCDIRGPQFIPPQGGYEDHCAFPNIVAKWSDTAWFNLETPGWNYVDVTLTNPSAKVLAYQFKTSGMSIDSVISLNGSPTYSSDIRFNAATGEILALSRTEATFDASDVPVPLVRIYFHETEELLCLEEVDAVVNEKYERITGIGGECMIPNSVRAEPNVLNVQLFPNPFSSQTTLSFLNPGNDEYSLSLFDITGKTVRIEEGITGDRLVIEKQALSPGIYTFTLTGKKIQTGKLVIQ